ncbi:hypothetical protein HCG49_08415 [Arenibacter sp. 6A1]|uniref:hypothetical protein n=1 Tax=Arenibacter sp. 6A1 TaxID=2720391 RepID=UPI001446BE9D|nr:hypothetical protein [Arenibacter sp. 6A1]NKI26584.1 hypothetical protein [Arenibacter sp. 6A1]
MKLSYFKKNFSSRKTNWLLGLMLVLDIIFVLAHVLIIYLIFIRVEFDWSASMLFLVNRDGGYPEIFQYFKYLLVLGAIVYFFIKDKAYNYFSWFLLFVMLLLDDSLKFHERFGTWVVEQFNYQPAFGFRAQDLGELTYVALFGSLLLISMVIGFHRGNEEYKKKNIDLGLLFVLFLFFGIVIDMMHVLIGGGRYMQLIMVILEDGGEMFSLSFLTWYFFFLIVKPKTHNKYLYQYFYRNKDRKFDKFFEFVFFNRTKVD